MEKGPVMKLAWFTPLLGLCWSSMVFSAMPASYTLDIEIIPADGAISVSGQVDVLLEDASQRHLEFSLHETFSISALAVDRIPVDFEVIESQATGFAEASNTIRVRLPGDRSRRELELSFAYEGRMSDFPQFGTPDSGPVTLDDEISAERVELSLYSAWFPSFGFGARFDSDLTIRPLPEGWTMACIGQSREESETFTRCQGLGVNDLVIVASPGLRVETVQTPAGSLRIYHTALPQAYVARESQFTGRTLEFFTGILGAPYSNGGLVQHVYSPRKLGQGGFARVGMTVFSEGRVLDRLARDARASNVRGAAHESGHFWWNMGAGQGDWINESFAEYFALLAVRELNGEKAFDKALARGLEAVRSLPGDAPALAQVPFSNDGHGYTIRYAKGALMLDHFRRLLGDETFYRDSRDFYQATRDKRIGTGEFRGFWKERLGGHRQWVDRWLDSAGGLPAGYMPTF